MMLIMEYQKELKEEEMKLKTKEHSVSDDKEIDSGEKVMKYYKKGSST